MSTNLSRRNHVVADICSALGYRGRLVAVGQTYGRDTITCHGAYWDGGSRTTWHAFDVPSRTLIDLPVSRDPVEYGGREADTVNLARIPEGVIVIAWDIVGGKDRGLRLFPSRAKLRQSVIGTRAQLALGSGAVAS